MERWSESPLVLSIAGTFAIHMIFVVCADAIVVTHPIYKQVPAPHIDIVDIEPTQVIKPPPPPIEKVEPVTSVPLQPVVKQARAVRAVAHDAPPPIALPPPTAPVAASGGAPIVAMDDIAPSATGVGVAKGARTTGHIGRGGIGAGTGAGIGSGTEIAAPVSVATIKTRAMPHGDYGYFSAGKDYPPEAKQLGIEGAIRVRLVVDEAGKVKSVMLLNHLGHGLDELALERARQIEFEPARDTDDHAVTSVVIWTFNMTLPK